MRYCTKCKKLYKGDETEKCFVCGKKTISDPSHYSLVNVVTANGFELERIRAALHDADIPYSYQEARKDAGIQILNSAPPENCDVFVPLSAYEKTMNVLIGIGAVKEEISQADTEKLREAEKAAEDEELPPEKARRIRILSGIAFILLLVLVVWLVDIGFEFVKSLFVK